MAPHRKAKVEDRVGAAKWRAVDKKPVRSGLARDIAGPNSWRWKMQTDAVMQDLYLHAIQCATVACWFCKVSYSLKVINMEL